jgi:LPS-assembly lipoprotein
MLRGLADTRLRWLVLMLVILSLVTACGFHLRGAVDIPPNLSPVFVEAPGNSAVGVALKDRFQVSGVQQTTSAKDARALVRILSESRRSRVGALDSNGKVIATELFLNLRFDARAATGKTLVEPQALEMSRTFENADVEVLGKQLEAEILYAEMTEDMTTQILAMLRAALPPG